MYKIASRISIEGGELVMTVAERLKQEGLEEGRKKVLEEGEMIRARSTYYHFKIKKPSKRSCENTNLTQEIKAIYDESNCKP